MAIYITQNNAVWYCFRIYLKVLFLNFFGKASLVMTYHLHQLDTISYLSLEQLKLISQVSIKSYFPTVITILLAKTLYPVLIYAHLGPKVCWSSLPSTKVHYRHVMGPSHHRSCVHVNFSEFIFNVVLNVLVFHFCGKNCIMFCVQRLRVSWPSLL